VQYTLETGAQVTVPIEIDHGQFIACDPVVELDIESYGDEALRAGIAVWSGGGGVTVFTASHWTSTTVTVALAPERPPVAADEWDHVVEAGLIVQSGRLHLYGPEDTGANEATIAVPPGTYSLIACGRDFDSTNDYDAEGSDSYSLILWPGPRLRRRVLKDGFSWMG
jgi:hypothetical protein